MDASEREQYQAAIHGDREAFEVIIRTHSRTLFAIAYGILQKREEAEDVVLIFRGAQAARVQLSVARREQRHRCRLQQRTRQGRVVPRTETSLPAPQTNHKLYSPNEEVPE